MMRTKDAAVILLFLLFSAAAQARVPTETLSQNRVKRFIAEVIQRAHTAVRRSEDVPGLIVRWSNVHGVDPLLVLAVIDHESNFRNHQTSKKGAKGYMQVEPSSVCKGGKCKDARNLQNPDVNIHYGAQLLAQSLSCFSSNPELRNEAFNYYSSELAIGLAVYNGGCGKLQKAIDKPDYYQEFFRQTQQYAKEVVSLYESYKELAESEPVSTKVPLPSESLPVISETIPLPPATGSGEAI